ncbi:hypothetical protein SteCoe_26146 [Stentor coeruleus]|uniref:Uncharacterized protein n=1 Tax=Stentor coeruleus TaxID=5963 RepID=A0A1R2BDI9_9CILI|nr:hypothetical protein SteCoe_26146 [Stentor coeruleus]
MEFSEEINHVSNSRLSLAEAVSQLEIAKQAFQKAEHIQSLLEKTQSEINGIKNTFNQLVHISIFNNRMDDMLNTIEKSIRARFDDFSSVYFSQLNAKISESQLEGFLNKKVGWKVFNALNQQVSSLQGHFDKHIFSEYESFKTKMKLELASKANDNKGFDMTSDEFSQMKSRLVSVEQKIEELFMEEDALQDDEDYDSQEEMDNMLDDIDMVAKREDTLDDEVDESALASNEVSTEAPQIKSEISLISENTTVEHVTSSSPEIEKKIPEPLKLEIEKPMSRHSRARGSSIGGESKTMQRRGSKESSVAASRILAGGAGMKQINRKIASLQKDIESNKNEIEESKKYTEKIENDIANCNSYIDNVDTKVKEILRNLDTMEASFIRALRRNGLDKKQKPKEQVIGSISKKELDAIDKKIEEKFKRVIIIENDLEKVHSDTTQLKKYYKDKLNEIINSLKNFDEFKTKTKEEFDNVSSEISTNMAICNKACDDLLGLIMEIKGPMTDLISDQQRENATMSEELRRHQELFRVIIEEYSAGKPKIDKLDLIDQAHKITEGYKKKLRPQCQTPDMSIKNKFYKSNFSYRLSPSKIDSNWLSSVPDGKAISLPRVKGKEKLIP